MSRFVFSIEKNKAQVHRYQYANAQQSCWDNEPEHNMWSIENDMQNPRNWLQHFSFEDMLHMYHVLLIETSKCELSDQKGHNEFQHFHALNLLIISSPYFYLYGIKLTSVRFFTLKPVMKFCSTKSLWLSFCGHIDTYCILQYHASSNFLSDN